MCTVCSAMTGRPQLNLDDSTLCLRVETKASPLLGHHASTFSPALPHTPPHKVSTTPTSTASSASSGQVCYICHCEASEEPLLRNVCGCKRHLVHPRCLATWLHYSAARRDGQEPPRCEVCLEKYKLPASVRTKAFVNPRRARRAMSPEIKAYSVPALLAFVYGFTFVSLGNDMESLICTCIVGNIIVLIAWLLFVVGRQGLPERAPEQRAVEDAVVLLCAYIAFLCAWLLQEWSLPRYNTYNTIATTHIVNAGCVVFSCVTRLVYRPCRAGCQCAWSRPPVTITLDLGD